MDNNLLQQNDEHIVRALEKINLAIKNFIDMSKDEPKFKEYYIELTSIGQEIFKLHEKLHSEFKELGDCEEKFYGKCDKTPLA